MCRRFTLCTDRPQTLVHGGQNRARVAVNGSLKNALNRPAAPGKAGKLTPYRAQMAPPGGLQITVSQLSARKT
ncbi:MAG: hypothetical protein PsegKO_36010 [Pseudohongiellaceae bacterium]